MLHCLTSKAQDTTKVKPKMYSIETLDGASIAGTVISEDDKQIVLKTKSLGDVTVLRSNIKTIHEVTESSFKNGSYWFENPNATRYVIGPSAFSLREGEGYYQNLYVFAQSVNVGITNHISIGGGTEIASIIFAQEQPQVFFITPKIAYHVAPKCNAGAGILYVNQRMDFYRSPNARSHYGILYGVGTYGSMDNNLTIGLGWGMHSYKIYDYSTSSVTTENGINGLPFITISGMLRPAKRFALTTENWLIPVRNTSFNYQTNTSTTIYDYQWFFSYGARFLGEHISVDFGFINNTDIANDIFIGIPYIDFVVKFGGKKRVKSK